MPLLKPEMTVVFEDGCQGGIGISDDGFLVFLRKERGEKRWGAVAEVPPKLAAYVDTFMAQYYHRLNNTYGCPQSEAIKSEVTGDGIFTDRQAD